MISAYFPPDDHDYSYYGMEMRFVRILVRDYAYTARTGLGEDGIRVTMDLSKFRRAYEQGAKTLRLHFCADHAIAAHEWDKSIETLFLIEYPEARP